MDPQQRKQRIYRVTFVGFVINIVLTAVKFAAGILGRSGAMIADAVHSLSDMATDVVVLFFARISAKPSDENHDFGHGKFETLASIFISLALAAVGAGILYSSFNSIARLLDGEVLPRPGIVAIAAALLSIVGKEWVYRYTVREARKLNSPSVEANAWHHRSDALSSVGTFVGIGCAYFLGERWRIADPIAAAVVSLFIMRVAWKLTRAGFEELMEQSLPKDEEEEILRIITADKAVTAPHNLRTRRIGGTVAIEVHIRVDGAMSVVDSHALTVDIERRLRERFGDTIFLSIHVEPIK